MSFLPDGEQIPAGASNYMRLSEPENKFRVLDSAITGYELWVDKKPKRNKSRAQFTPEELANADINKFTGLKKTPQYFWCFPVYNYATEKIEILEVTQVSVMNGIKDYLDDPDFGDPKEYDLIVVRDEETEQVKYRVKAKPPKPMDEGVMQAYRDMEIDLNQLYVGGDPFSPKDEVNVDDIPDFAGDPLKK